MECGRRMSVREKVRVTAVARCICNAVLGSDNAAQMASMKIIRIMRKASFPLPLFPDFKTIMIACKTFWRASYCCSAKWDSSTLWLLWLIEMGTDHGLWCKLLWTFHESAQALVPWPGIGNWNFSLEAVASIRGKGIGIIFSKILNLQKEKAYAMHGTKCDLWPMMGG